MKRKALLLICLLFICIFYNTKVNASEFINRIDINYDTSNILVHPYYTYNQVKNKIKANWIVDENAQYSKGDNILQMVYCPSSERCTTGYTNGYNEKIMEDRYTYIYFQVYSLPW